MKTKIAVGAAMLLSLGTALAGSFIYTKDKAAGEALEIAPVESSVQSLDDLTPETIAKWKATAATIDYSPPMLPI
jgi:hypothetical protein